jgi:DNA primase
MKTYQDIKSAATIDAAIPYTETLLGIRFKNIKKNRYSAPCPFHADTKESFMVYVNKEDNETFNAFTDADLAGLLNDNSVNGYGYYCRQIDFRRKYPLSRSYGDSLAGRIVFPIYDSDVLTTGLVGRHPDDWGVRWLKQQSREVPLSDRAWLYSIEKAARYIRQYRTIILVEGIND